MPVLLLKGARYGTWAHMRASACARPGRLKRGCREQRLQRLRPDVVCCSEGRPGEASMMGGEADGPLWSTRHWKVMLHLHRTTTLHRTTIHQDLCSRHALKADLHNSSPNPQSLEKIGDLALHMNLVHLVEASWRHPWPPGGVPTRHMRLFRTVKASWWRPYPVDAHPIS